MPHQNRVTPLGEIVADAWRGAFMGNRGCLHDAAGRLGPSRWRHANWVCCLTDFRGRHRPIMPPGRWTALFFWDEPSALAAGHRPCAECRRADYRRFFAAWERAGLPGAGPVTRDRILHAARVRRDRSRVTFRANAAALPDGAFIVVERRPALVWQHALRPWSAGGYAGPRSLPSDDVDVLTPAPVIETFRAGYAVEPRL